MKNIPLGYLLLLAIVVIFYNGEKCEGLAPPLKQVVDGTYIHPYVLGDVVALDAYGLEQWAAASLKYDTVSEKNESVVFLKRSLQTNQWKVHQIVQSPYSGLRGFGKMIEMYAGTALISAPSSIVGANTGSVEVYVLNEAGSTSPLIESDGVGVWELIQTLSRAGESGTGTTLDMSQNGWMVTGNAGLKVNIWSQNSTTKLWTHYQALTGLLDLKINGIAISRDGKVCAVTGDQDVSKWTRGSVSVNFGGLIRIFTRITFPTQNAASAEPCIVSPTQVTHSAVLSPFNVYINSASSTMPAGSLPTTYFSTVTGATRRICVSDTEMYAYESPNTLRQYTRSSLVSNFAVTGTFAVDPLVATTNSFGGYQSLNFPHSHRTDASPEWTIVGAPSTNLTVGGYLSFYSNVVFTSMFN